MTITLLSPPAGVRPFAVARLHLSARAVLGAVVAPVAVGWLLYCCLTIGGAALR